MYILTQNRKRIAYCVDYEIKEIGEISHIIGKTVLGDKVLLGSYDRPAEAARVLSIILHYIATAKLPVYKMLIIGNEEYPDAYITEDIDPFQKASDKINQLLYRSMCDE